MQIHQILPSFDPGDAIGNNVLEIRKILRSWGYRSDIYSQHVHPKLARISKPLTEYKKISSHENIVIFHFAIGSDVSEFVKNLPDKKVILYHNITPPNYFIGINDTLFHLLVRGRRELKEFRDITDLALGVSEYNKNELVEVGFRHTGVLPIILDFGSYDQKPDQDILSRFDRKDKWINIIFVGRLSPHKKQDDIIKTFYYYNKFIEPKSRLILVGSYNGIEKYYEKLKLMIKQLDLENVYITGQINFRELLAYYKVADVFVSMSEHEGFCVPILESMYFNIPIIAYRSSAIPYTLEDSGILVNKKNYTAIAEMINLLIGDNELRRKIIKKQKDRLKYFDRSNTEKILRNHLDSIISTIK